MIFIRDIKCTKLTRDDIQYIYNSIVVSDEVKDKDKEPRIKKMRTTSSTADKLASYIITANNDPDELCEIIKIIEGIIDNIPADINAAFDMIKPLSSHSVEKTTKIWEVTSKYIESKRIQDETLKITIKFINEYIKNKMYYSI